MKIKHHFLTGLPFVGKTTALLRIIQSLEHASGFITLADIRNGNKTGLNLVTSGGQTFHVAAVNPLSPQRTGRYFVNPEILKEAMEKILEYSSHSKYIYMDEIGTLYCQSSFFTDTVRTLLESRILIGIVARKGHAFIHEIHRRQDCSFTEINGDNRDDIPGIILKRLV